MPLRLSVADVADVVVDLRDSRARANQETCSDADFHQK